MFIQYKGPDFFTHGAWNFLRFQVYILEYFLRTLKRDDENTHICVYHSVCLVSHRNYRCRPRRISGMPVYARSFDWIHYSTVQLKTTLES